jgi:trehalose-phosphatase
MWNQQTVVDLVESKLQGYRLILVSNREPYIHRFVGDRIECERPTSGLATVLDPVMRTCGGVWITHGSGDADREVVNVEDCVRVPPDKPSLSLRRIWLPKELEARYYGLANQGLWPLCHMVFTRPIFNPEDWEAYKEVNRIFADAVLVEAEDSPALVFIQDFHFGLLPRLVTQQNPNLIIAHFWHIPWPNPDVFRAFPWKEELIDGLLGNDLLGFQLRADCQTFLDAAECTLEAKADRERFEITRGGKHTMVRAFPISIDFDDHVAKAQKDETKENIQCWRRQLGWRGGFVGIGIDRIDYTKGIPERFRALDRVLTTYPEYLEHLLFVQIGVPSRSRIREYKALEEEIELLSDEINSKWSIGSWRPLVFIKQHFSEAQMMALHCLSDFCVVSSLHDGMNLVSKEYVASRWDEDGVLILSRFAGAAHELTDAILVNPFDEEELAEAMRAAMLMPLKERKRRMQRMRATVAENNIYRWTGKIISTLFTDGGGKSFSYSSVWRRPPRINVMLSSLKEVLAEVLSRTKVGATSLYLDFDGTLAPIAPEPSEARLDESVRRALTKIVGTKRMAVGVISGRGLVDLQPRVGVDGLVYAGNHGLEIVGNGLRFVDPAALSAMDELHEVSKQLLSSLWQIPGIRIEEKRLTTVVHYRQVANVHLSQIRDAVKQAVAPYAPKLRDRSGQKSIEILPRTNWNKGEAVLWINHLLGISARSAIYAGNDATDEDAFKALSGGVTIRVGTCARTWAHYVLSGPGEVLQLLEGIAGTEEQLKQNSG